MLKHPIIVLLLITILSLIQVNGSPLDEKLQCMAKNQVKPEDLQNMDNFEKVAENILCAIKCTMEVNKIINEDGSLNADNIENCEKLSQLPDDQKTELKECLNTIDKIETCQDMLKASTCAQGLNL